MAFNIGRNIEHLEESASARGGMWMLVLAALRSRYFLMSLTFYGLLLVLLGGHVVSIYVAERGMFGEAEALLVLPDRPPPPPRPQQQQTKPEATEVTVSAAAPSADSPVTRLAVDAPAAFVTAPTPMPAPTVRPGDIKVQTDLARQIEAQRIARLMDVRDFQQTWQVDRWRNPRQVRAEFTIFKAKYQGGDWNCNPTDMENLMLQIRRWSSDRIRPNLHPEVLDVGTEQLFELKPPFIYMTGHKDFTLLDVEVRNIRDYLMLGGAVWADSALAGRRSRFDMAFRREIKRVMPDREFEVIGLDHPVFNNFFRNIDLPSGMNYYQEPIEVINIGEEVAVVYTLNGYGHFWESRLDNNDNIQWGRVNLGTDEKPSWRFVHGPHAGSSGSRTDVTSTLYRNISNETVRDAYKFGINVVVHLLTRYQKHFQFLPRELPEASGMRGGRSARE